MNIFLGELKVLFIQASTSSEANIREQIAKLSREIVPIKPEFLNSEYLSVPGLRDLVLKGNYDAIIVEDKKHTFNRAGKRQEEVTVEKALGLTDTAEAQQIDIGCSRTAIALVDYLKTAFTEAKKDRPKFGYLHQDVSQTMYDKFDLLDRESNEDFMLSSTNEDARTHIHKIYRALNIT